MEGNSLVTNGAYIKWLLYFVTMPVFAKMGMFLHYADRGI